MIKSKTTVLVIASLGSLKASQMLLCFPELSKKVVLFSDKTCPSSEQQTLKFADFFLDMLYLVL